MYKLRHVCVDPPPGLRCNFSIPEREEELLDEILVVSFVGVYPPGSQGNAHATYMSAMALQALAAFDPVCLILDLSDLSYVWGDSLLGVFQAIGQYTNEPGETPPPLLTVTGPKSTKALLSLVSPASGATDLSWHFEDLEAAIEYGLKASQEWLES